MKKKKAKKHLERKSFSLIKLSTHYDNDDACRVMTRIHKCLAQLFSLMYEINKIKISFVMLRFVSTPHDLDFMSKIHTLLEVLWRPFDTAARCFIMSWHAFKSHWWDQVTCIAQQKFNNEVNFDRYLFIEFNWVLWKLHNLSGFISYFCIFCLEHEKSARESRFAGLKKWFQWERNVVLYELLSRLNSSQRFDRTPEQLPSKHILS